MKRVLTAVILVPIVVIALFRAPLWLFALLVLGVALLAAKEYFDIVKASGFRPFRVPCYALLAWVFLALGASASKTEPSAFMLVSLLGLIVPIVIWLFILLVLGMRRDPISQLLADTAVSFMLLPYVAIPLGLMIVQRSMFGPGALFLLYVMLLVWTGDIAAYYAGRALGRRKLAPRISPGKTWEGAIASTLCSIAVALALFHWAVPIQQALLQIHVMHEPWNVFRDASQRGPALFRFHGPIWLIAIFALCVNVSAQLGDLVESAMKRGAAVKDSGTLLPGHGGVLDRIDALLFAVPVGWLFYIAGLGIMFSTLQH